MASGKLYENNEKTKYEKYGCNGVEKKDVRNTSKHRRIAIATINCYILTAIFLNNSSDIFIAVQS